MFVSAKTFVEQQRRQPLKTRLLQIACIAAVGNDRRIKGILEVAKMRYKLPNVKIR
jgi:hypothetical protein